MFDIIAISTKTISTRLEHFKVTDSTISKFSQTQVTNDYLIKVAITR